MREVFALEDIFNVMIELETLGNKHYENMRDMTDNAKLKVLFGNLAAQELAHKKTYSGFKSEMIAFENEKVDDEYKGYMDSLLDQTVKFLTASRGVRDFKKGFEISVQLEKDTILFLNELRSLADASYHMAIDRIISQERGHLKALYEIADRIK